MNPVITPKIPKPKLKLKNHYQVRKSKNFYDERITVPMASTEANEMYAFFDQLKLAHLLPLLRAEEVEDFLTLHALTDEDLQDCGLPMGARIRLLQALRDRAR